MRKFFVIVSVICLLTLVCSLGMADTRKGRRKFFRTMLKKKVVTFEDVSKSFYMLHFNSFPAEDFDGRVAKLEADNLLPKNHNWTKDSELNRGEMAYVIVRILNIKGGLKMRLGLKTERYCHRELTNMGLFPHANQRRLSSGPELLAIYNKCSEYKQKDDK